MITVDKILARHRRPSGLAGGGASTALRRDLERHARSMIGSYVALISLLLILLVGLGVVVTLESRACREVRASLLVAAIAAVAAILDISRRAVDEWSKARLMVRLCRHLDAAQVDSLIDRLLK